MEVQKQDKVMIKHCLWQTIPALLSWICIVAWVWMG